VKERHQKKLNQKEREENEIMDQKKEKLRCVYADSLYNPHFISTIFNNSSSPKSLFKLSYQKQQLPNSNETSCAF